MQNPHVRFFVEGVDANGRAITWNLETTSLNWLQRLQVPPESFREGSRVKFAGWPSKRSPERIYALNMLAADGQEILLFRTAKARWRSDDDSATAPKKRNRSIRKASRATTSRCFASGRPFRPTPRRLSDRARRSR